MQLQIDNEGYYTVKIKKTFKSLEEAKEFLLSDVSKQCGAFAERFPKNLTDKQF